MSVAPAGVALTGNTGGPDSDYRLALNRNNQWRSQLQILIQDAIHRVGFAALIYFPEVHAVDENFDFADQVARCMEPLSDKLTDEQKDDLREVVGLAIMTSTGATSPTPRWEVRPRRRTCRQRPIN